MGTLFTKTEMIRFDNSGIVNFQCPSCNAIRPVPRYLWGLLMGEIHELVKRDLLLCCGCYSYRLGQLAWRVAYQVPNEREYLKLMREERQWLKEFGDRDVFYYVGWEHHFFAYFWTWVEGGVI